ncbi:ArsR/SmtB family transcription factor [Halomarina salina]|uniref:ArsR/SmtB family transcription factor n=1 Tax=Halomarina salina TaxID=1872699 RepID=A0ABD5RM81_9EURY|nr:helix-turn-helix domain-containing protein [Halomarina salina]
MSRDSDDPAEAFSALSDPKRVTILRTLWKADGPMGFSELREAVGMRDSGQFNYHLGKLRDRFVVDGDEGYQLSVAGRRVVGALLSGAYTGDESAVSSPLGQPCPSCGGEVTFRYEDDRVWFDCEDCELTATNTIPPGAFAGYDTATYPEVAQRYLRTRIQHLSSGFCTTCEGRVRISVRRVGDIWPEEAGSLDDLPFVVYDCERCGDRATTDLGLALIDRSAVIAFYHDHGVDVRERPLWSFVSLHDSAVDSADPFRASATFREGDGALTLTVDDELTVRGVEHY